ncbi:LuxR C-terminal-related transcriptional regulator [Iningainema tapete]|uniref:HTH luxR-type domain-containing protein n=1 Tax=Iningainema tapete BLCC-T55 TaxID=2748662 RepID=A0A8J6XFQ3_9CYAN|nr:LuxR C-terminal-related transcriptional regulator [Iningainema tapete]MBD2770689.1 hypothetical protein [Iningainema tapete BLCC-T55]
MVTKEFLKGLFQARNLSEAEAEVVFRALEEKSIEAIAKELKISANAVRKRLGEAYDKLGVPGRGPGKLAKLQQIISSQYQTQTIQRVLIWWSGNDGKQLADGLKNTILSYPQLETRVCTLDPVAGKAWQQEVEQSLKKADFTIGCLTSSMSENPWVNFAAGFLAGRLNNRVVRLGEKLRGVLAQSSSIDGTSQQELEKLLQEITNSEQQKAKEWVEFKFTQWQKELACVPKEPISSNDDGISRALDSIKETENCLKANQYVRENVCFELIILNSVTEIRHQLLGVNSDYRIPAVLYPQRLIQMQREWKARVTALALVDHQEQFWPEAVGREILDTADPESTRVFVFTRPEDFDRNFEMLLEHASKYNVFAMSYKVLASNYDRFVKDFSVIEVSNSEVLAEYIEPDAKSQAKIIRFGADTTEVKVHKDKIKEIINSKDTIPIEKKLREIILRAQQIKISNFEALRTLNQIQEEIRTNLRKQLFT